MRRDLTYVICTFLEALQALQAKDGQEYHEYRDVITYAITNYKATPSDYSILERWKLIKTLHGKGNSKYKALSEHGIAFLDDRLMVSLYHYQIPHTEAIMFSKEKTNFSLLKVQSTEKENKTPFHDSKLNNI